MFLLLHLTISIDSELTKTDALCHHFSLHLVHVHLVHVHLVHVLAGISTDLEHLMLVFHDLNQR